MSSEGSHFCQQKSNEQDQIDLSSCRHLSDFRGENQSDSFRYIRSGLRVKALGLLRPRNSDLSEPPSCSKCGVRAGNRMYACLACQSVFCHDPKGTSHIASHANSLPCRHGIMLDVDRAELFCCSCNDQVYDGDLDAQLVSSQLTSFRQSIHSLDSLSKRQKIHYQLMHSDTQRRILTRSCSSRIDADDWPRGLRGLNNLGNTCFMNSVLQALVHTPVLSNYFLSERHGKHHCVQQNGVICNIRNRKRKDNAEDIEGIGVLQLCLVCNLDAVYSAVYSGIRAPYSPARFLYSWWQHATDLASYEQQDAHEFFISILDGIHENMEKHWSQPNHEGSGRGDCCIAHRVFKGILQSDVMCMACGFTSTTYDPCVDISLDLETHKDKGALVKAECPRTTRSSKKTQVGQEDSTRKIKMSTLTGCLNRFTSPEKLGSDQKFFCQQCNERQESLKQMSIKKLPFVLCFHIKRFEQSSVRRMLRKIDQYMQFPILLDMAPHLSSSILCKRYGNRIYPFDSDDDSEASHELPSEFELFALVTHTGKLDAGHYVTFLHLSGHWYKCDDAWITQVNEDLVRAAEGYMLLYVRKNDIFLTKQ